MRIKCSGTELSNSFNKVVKAITSKINSPILDGIKIMAYGNELMLIATDTELTIEDAIHAEILEEGECLVAGRFTADLSGVMNNQSIEMISDDKNIIFIYGENSINVKLMNINEYPPILDVDTDTNICINAKDFKYLIAKTSFSASKDDSMPVLKGCLFEIDDKALRFVALDGFRLAIASKATVAGTNSISVIIPLKALSEIAKIIDEDDLLKIKVDKKRIVIDNGHTKITSRLINGDYIKYNNIIPTNLTTSCTVLRTDLLDMLSRVSVIAKHSKNRLIRLDFKDCSLAAAAESEIGSIAETVVAKTDGKDVVIGFNYRYIQECVEATESEYIRLSMSNSFDPFIIENIDNANDNLFLVLPIRVNS